MGLTINGTTWTERAKGINEPQIYEANASEMFVDYSTTSDSLAIREDALRFFLGYNVMDGTSISRVSPFSLKAYGAKFGKSLQRNFFATRCELTSLAAKDWEPISQVGRGTGLYAKVRFSTLAWDVLSDADMRSGGYTIDGGLGTSGVPDEALLMRNITKNMRPSARTQPLPFPSFYVVGGINSKVHPIQNSVLNFPLSQFDLTWHDVPKDAVRSIVATPSIEAITMVTFERCIGTVNSTILFGLRGAGSTTTGGFAKGTMYLAGAYATPTRSPFGDRYYDCHFSWLFNPNGHYATYIPILSVADNTPGWKEIATGNTTTSPSTNLVTQTDGVNPVNWRDHNLLFRGF